MGLSKIVAQIHVRVISDSRSIGWLQCGTQFYPCLLGRSGKSFRKREGDGKSPKGSFKFVYSFYRSERLKCPSPAFAFRTTSPSSGWCDDVRSWRYNKMVKLPFAGSHESFTRNDNAYDIVLTTSHNQKPRIRGFGSAIFLHLIRSGSSGTDGCIALKRENLLKVLSRIGQSTTLII